MTKSNQQFTSMDNIVEIEAELYKSKQENEQLKKQLLDLQKRSISVSSILKYKTLRDKAENLRLDAASKQASMGDKIGDCYFVKPEVPGSHIERNKFMSKILDELVEKNV